VGVIAPGDVEKVASAARGLPPAAGVYVEEDYVLNLLETVIDYQLHTTAVVKALQHFRDNRWDEVRTLDDLERLLERFPESQDGNTALAEYLWGYRLWRRAQELRGLVRYFREIGVVDAASLKEWAHKSRFQTDFRGRVKGLGRAVYHALLMRQGVDTVKPDVHVRRFAEAAVGRRLGDGDVVDVVTEAARRLGIKAYELDWRIWEASR
jgi:hypothetical protein